MNTAFAGPSSEGIKSHPERLVLGAAQLGMAYGIANRRGQPDQAVAEKIVAEAWQGRIREIDTAQGYGESEAVLGAALRSLGIQDQARVISKLDPRKTDFSANAVSRSIEGSLERLSVPRLHGLMLHREELLDEWDRGLGEILVACRDRGLVEALGVSVYSPRKALTALGMDDLTLLQVPANVMDRRFMEAGVFDQAREKNRTVYIRSVFLQGLLLMSPGDLAPDMDFASAPLEKYDTLVKETGMTRQNLALVYIRDAYPDAKVLFGVDTPEQVRRNLAAWNHPGNEDLPAMVRGTFKAMDEKLLNPALWPH